MNIKYDQLHANIAKEVGIDKDILIYIRKRLLDKTNYPNFEVFILKLNDRINRIQEQIPLLDQAVINKKQLAEKKPRKSQFYLSKVNNIKQDIINTINKVKFLREVLKVSNELNQLQNQALILLILREPKEGEVNNEV